MRIANRLVLSGIIWGLLAVPNARAAIIYVNASATGGDTGESWANAFRDLQDALAAAEWGDEIWVAAGTYKPTDTTDRTISFVMQAGVGMYGGFDGTETVRSQRDWITNASVLSGEINTTGTATDNSYHVLIGADLARLDGFMVMLGYAHADGGGGGMLNVGESPTVTNCTFSSNTATSAGGGILNIRYSDPTITNCTFNENTAYFGGGIYNDKSTPTIVNCTFSSNAADSGGGMDNNSSNATIIDCVFNANTASNTGGALDNTVSNLIITNCTFSANTANGGAGINNGYSSDAAITSCVFIANETATFGGGINNFSSSPTILNCTFTGNMAPYSGGGVMSHSGDPTITNCTFSANMANSGGGIYNYISAPIFTNCTFTGNTASEMGGAIYLGGNSLIINCILWGNISASASEIYRGFGKSTFRNCSIQGSGGSGELWNFALGIDGGNNIDSDPLFRNLTEPAGSDGIWMTADDGLFLLPESPCTNAGLAEGAPETDILGNIREGVPDIGAYEFILRSGEGRRWLDYE